MKTLTHNPVKPLNLATIKAGLLCMLMIFVSTPNLHAQTQCATPYESNCVVTMGGGGCGNGGVYPCSITYVVTVNDTTSNALIHYQVFCDGNNFSSGQLYNGGQFTVSSTYPSGGCYGGSLTGNMYATASGYTQSNTGYLSF